MARGVNERDLPTLLLNLIGTNMLGDAPGLTLGHMRLTQGIQQRCLAMVDVSHDGDHWRTRHKFAVAAEVIHMLGNRSGRGDRRDWHGPDWRDRRSGCLRFGNLRGTLLSRDHGEPEGLSNRLACIVFKKVVDRRGDALLEKRLDDLRGRRVECGGKVHHTYRRGQCHHLRCESKVAFTRRIRTGTARTRTTTGTSAPCPAAWASAPA